jgi:hypothetical protein
LFEAFRDTREAELVSRLAAWDTQVVEEAVERVFLDHLHFLVSDRGRDNRLSDLIERARDGALSEAERSELRRLTQRGPH